MIRKLITIICLPLAALATTSVALAVDVTPTINPNLPGTYDIATQGPLAVVGNFYQFALMLGGLLAFVMIVYAGVKYAMSAGNPSVQSDAKDQITQALLGLLLLASTYIILNTINPALTKLTLPTLEKLQAPTAPAVQPATLAADESYGCKTSDGLLNCSSNRSTATCSDVKSRCSSSPPYSVCTKYKTTCCNTANC